MNKKYIAWISPNHEHVNSDLVENLGNMNEFEWDCEYDGIDYSYGNAAEEAEKPLWEKVKKADEIRENFGR